MQVLRIQRFVLLFIFLLTATFNGVQGASLLDGYSNINIKVAHVQGTPKNTSILASINGHTLTVTFTENLGDVLVEVTTASGGTVDYGQVWTPDSFIAYIYSTGSYVVTITLENGDEYYGEFEITN